MTKVSPLNNFFKIPEIVINKIVTYNKRWLVFAKNFCPLKILGSNFEQMSIITTLVISPMVFLGGSLYSLDMLPSFWQTITYFNPVVYLINGLRFAFYGVSDFNVWISISSMVFFLIVCVSVVSVLLKKGYNIKSSIYLIN